MPAPSSRLAPFFLGPQGAHLTPGEIAFLNDTTPVGFILFGRNMQTWLQVKDLVAHMRALVGPTCRIWIDEEGGRVSRLSHLGPLSPCQIATLPWEIQEWARAGFRTTALQEVVGPEVFLQSHDDLWPKMAALCQKIAQMRYTHAFRESPRTQIHLRHNGVEHNRDGDSASLSNGAGTLRASFGWQWGEKSSFHSITQNHDCHDSLESPNAWITHAVWGKSSAPHAPKTGASQHQGTQASYSEKGEYTVCSPGEGAPTQNDRYQNPQTHPPIHRDQSWASREKETDATPRMAPEESALVQCLWTHMSEHAPDSALAQASQRVYDHYTRVAMALTALGIDGNCAPVLDVACTHTAPFLRPRCLGSDPLVVAHLGAIAVYALQIHGVTPVFKHMPGHGMARLDSHTYLPTIAATPAAWGRHLFPFLAAPLLWRAGYAAKILHAWGAKDVNTMHPPLFTSLPFLGAMSSHLSIPWIDTHPVTFSRPIIQGMRQACLDPGILLVTDDLFMGALQGVALPQRVVRALSAGHDAVLLCQGTPQDWFSCAQAWRTARNPAQSNT